MKIKAIEITNFRCFDELRLELHPELTVLTAVNGGGKTTLLDALRVALWPFVKGFDLGSQTGKSATVQIEDVRIARVGQSMEAQLPSKVQAEGFWTTEDNRLRSWLQQRESIKPRTNTKALTQTKSLTAYAKELQQDVRQGGSVSSEELSLPLIVYLGTGRLWYQGRYNSEVEDAEPDLNSQSRLWAYQNCLTATSSYKQFEKWFGDIFKSYRELQIAELEGETADPQLLNSFKNAIETVQTAINALTEEETGWRNLQYRSSQNQQLVMEHPEQGFVPLSQLSDGLRNIVVMVSDIAFRCYKLNPHLGADAARETPGVALIDEVDMFLHPSWQQRIIAALRQAFPRIQFVVTTHSPQVLSTVPAESIRILSAEGVETPLQQSKGVASNLVMADVQHVDAVPDLPEAHWLQRYKALLSQTQLSPEQTEEKDRLAVNIERHFGLHHPEWLECQRLERLMQMKAKAAAKIAEKQVSGSRNA